MYEGPYFLRAASANNTKVETSKTASGRISKTSYTSAIRLFRSSVKVVSLTIEEIFFLYILLNALVAIMTSDYAMVRTVRSEFARRLPSALVSLVLEFSNWANHELKKECTRDLYRFARHFSVAVAYSHGEDVISNLVIALNKKHRLHDRAYAATILRAPGDPADHISCVAPSRCDDPRDLGFFIERWEKRLEEGLRKGGACHRWGWDEFRFEVGSNNYVVFHT